MCAKQKRCSKCGEVRMFEDFNRDKTKNSGLSSHCKACRKEQRREYRKENSVIIRKKKRIYYETNRTEILEQKKIYHATLGFKEMRSERQKEYLLDPSVKKKVNARRDANHAFERGEIDKHPCLICGTNNGLEKHHCDYDKPLDVTWLCRKHHRELHKTIKEMES